MDSNESEFTESIMDINIPNQETRIQEYNEISSKLSIIHSSYLFYRDNIRTELIPELCSKIYTTLVRRIGGTDDNLSSAGWNDFGYYLGLTGEEIMYIKNSVKSCPTDMVLRVFSQSDQSTLEIITQSLIKMERFDVMEGIYDPLDKLLKALLRTEEGERDHGYHSNSSIRKFYKLDTFANNIPIALQWQSKKIITDDLKKPSVLLTYYDDGIDTVKKIIRACREISSNNQKINVICLEDIKSTVVMNPEQYIRHYFDKVDFVFPVLTKGYFDAINSPSRLCPSIMDNIDCAYVKFIYTLMSSHYINGHGCRNTQVRSILSDDNNEGVLAKLYKYPVLSAYVRGTPENLQKLFI